MPPAPRPVAREATVAKRATDVATCVRARDSREGPDDSEEEETAGDGLEDDGSEGDGSEDDTEGLVIGT
ncbi:hypothetical protein QP912_09250 [Corynebacterium pseudodiphtheriticum]|uniref:hypothetical protein n=1 Tax=Corynebacterium pseudodiphtheriticum TaxID=37637 RepID=UPI00254C64D3|nr:hypothetical protein [Corynebacterium pseudodiphtheriticum]MDK8775591.1 hypothetical protein [Corynebacterium pseudodiphtheriticum]